MRVHVLIALSSATLAFGACGKHEPAQPNGTGNYAEIPANVQDMVPDDVFPKAKQLAKDCENLQDLASCNQLGWMLAVGADPPIQHADQTDKTVTDSYHIDQLKQYASVPQDTESANALFAAACEAGWSSACVSLVRQGVAEDPAAILTDACAQGEADACALLGEGAQNGGIDGLSKEQIVIVLERACDNGRIEACLVQAQVDENIGKNTAPEVGNPRLLHIRARSNSADVNIYTNDVAQARAIANRAREAFGDDANVSFHPSEGSAQDQWLQIAPELLALANGVPNNATLTLRRNSLSFTSVISDSDERSAVRTALERLAGEDFKLTTLLTQAEIDAAEEARKAKEAEKG